MIKTVSDLLGKLAEAEARRLNTFHLTHGPTIGAMYEGLAQEIVKLSMPTELQLDVVSGFITDNSGQLSPQIDCMLVRGCGLPVPYTDFFKWHVKDVIAVLEVKKTLYSADLADSHSTLRGVLESHRRHVQNGLAGDSFDISSTGRAFATITGRVCPPPSDIVKLPFDLQIIYHALIVEQMSPVRIAIGFDGFRTEASLRRGLTGFIERNIGRRGHSPTSLPQLIISGQYSIAKLNGQPYCVRSSPDGWWLCLASSSANPLRLMLEYIWTRLTREYPLKGLWGDDLDCERFVPITRAHPVKSDSIMGWEYSFIEVDSAVLKEAPATASWEPTAIGEEEFVIFEMLRSGSAERRDDPELLSWLRDRGREIDELTESLLSTGLVALNGDVFELVADCAVVALPDGRWVVAETGSGRLARWVERFMERWKERRGSQDPSDPGVTPSNQKLSRR